MNTVTTHPWFKHNQVLTETELNELTDYLTKQDRGTHSQTFGAGIFNGLDPVYEKKQKRLVMSAGAAVSSAGYLFKSPVKIFTQLLPFQPDSDYSLFKPIDGEELPEWLLDSVEDDEFNSERIELFQLVDPDDETPPESPELVDIADLDHSFFDTRVMLIYLDIQDYVSREYLNTYQPDAPYRQYAWKFLLAKKEDLLDNIRQTRDSFVSEESLKTSLLMSDQFPHLYLQRPRFKRLNGGKSASEVYRRAILQALGDFQMSCDFWRNYVDSLVGTYLDFTPLIEAVEKFCRGIRQKKQFSAVHYECLKILVENLNLLNQSIYLFVQKFINCLDFPQHLLLGNIQVGRRKMLGDQAGSDLLRNSFKSVHSSRGDDELSRMMFFYRKIMQVVEQFEPAPPSTCHIYLTPISQGDPDPIPAFFKDSAVLAHCWDFDLSTRGKSYLVHTPERYGREDDQLLGYENALDEHRQGIAAAYIYVYNLHKVTYQKAKFYRDLMEAVRREPTATPQIIEDMRHNKWLSTVNFRPRTTAMDCALFAYLCSLYLATSQRCELDRNNDEIIIRAAKRACREVLSERTRAWTDGWGDAVDAAGALVGLYTLNLIRASRSCDFTRMFESANCSDSILMVSELKELALSMDLALTNEVIAVLESSNDYKLQKRAVAACSETLSSFFSKLLCYTGEIVHARVYLRTPLKFYQEKIDAFYVDGHLHGNVADVQKQLDRLTNFLDIEFNYNFVQSINTTDERKLIRHQFDHFKETLFALNDTLKQAAQAIFSAKTDPLMMENIRRVLLHVDPLMRLAEINGPGGVNEILERNYDAFMRGLRRITDFHTADELTAMVGKEKVNVELIYWFPENYSHRFIRNLIETFQYLKEYDATPEQRRTPLFKYYQPKPTRSINTVFPIRGLTHTPRIEPGSEFVAICDQHGFIYSHAVLQSNEQLP